MFPISFNPHWNPGKQEHFPLPLGEGQGKRELTGPRLYR